VTDPDTISQGLRPLWLAHPRPECPAYCALCWEAKRNERRRQYYERDRQENVVPVHRLGPRRRIEAEDERKPDRLLLSILFIAAVLACGIIMGGVGIYFGGFHR